MGTDSKPLSKLFWIDMEMTGLDENICHILEIAVAISDLDLDILEEYQRVIHQPPDVLARMDEWCTKTHGETGLMKEVASGVPLATAETDLVALAKKHFGNEKLVLCGNSVFQDRKFIERYMPRLASMLHYRLIDVSSFKEVFKAKYGIHVEKKDAHRAREDILESMAELRHYLKFIQVR